MDLTRPELLSAGDAARAIREGYINSVQLVEACLAQIRSVEPQVQAWQYLDADHAVAQARGRDLDRSEGRHCGPLHGVPVGIKDVIDTADMPTEDGTVLHAGRRPVQDATAVSMLRAAGAVIMGKTVTTELASYSPGKTRNPHNPEHTPGGSSSGSAAAVAAGMVPLALGTQTNGSVIRPAAFCGVYGFKPSFGLISRQGVLRQAHSLDTIGVFARTLQDIALLTEQLIGYDDGDADTRPSARPPLCSTLAQDPPMPPRLAFVKTPHWEAADGATHEAFSELVSVLGEQCQEYPLPDSLNAAWDWHRTIAEAEMAVNLEIEWERGRDQLSERMLAQLGRGREISAFDYLKARSRVGQLNEGFDELFARFDAILTPAAPGSAPKGMVTGDPNFCTLWTLCGMPACSLPLMNGPDGLPMGVQLVGRRGDDARLLRTARWLVTTAQSDGTT